MHYINGYFEETMATVILLSVVVFLRILAAKSVKRYARISEILEHRTNLVIKYLHMLITLISIAVLFIIWGVKTENIFTTLSAVITVVGVALFAQWSILSNITSGMILLFSFPFKIGDSIRIHDKDFPIEAEIIDIRAFHTLLRTPKGETITYPNNQLLQKGISIILPEVDDREFTD